MHSNARLGEQDRCTVSVHFAQLISPTVVNFLQISGEFSKISNPVFSNVSYAMTTWLNCLLETILMCGHSMGSCAETKELSIEKG